MGNWGDEVAVDLPLERAGARDFDAQPLPGGLMNPDTLRMLPDAVELVRAFFASGKPVATIRHGPSRTAIEADAARSRRVTSWPSLEADRGNAGAELVDQTVVVDQGLVARRKPDDIPAFNRAMIGLFTRLISRRSTSRR